MGEQSIREVITDSDPITVLALTTSIIVLITAVITMILSFKNKKKVQKIEILVNSRLDKISLYTRQLTSVLEQEGISVPPYPNDEAD